MTQVSALQLSDFLIAPKESLDTEIKNWLDLGNKEGAAKLAKAAIALANHGGGTLLLGFKEDRDAGVFVPDVPRPADLRMYGQDAVSAIIARHAEPNFHCDVHIVERAADGERYPIFRVPPSTVPIRSKVDSAEGSIKANVYYIRRPGPKSEQPGTGAEWDALIRRCVTASRTDMLDSIRSILTGVTTPLPAPVAVDAGLDAWEAASRARWQMRIASLPADARARLPLGSYFCAYEIVRVAQVPSGRELLEWLYSVPKKTGWPPFLVIHNDTVQPGNVDGAVEAWFGSAQSDPSHSDFWRASMKGQFFLLRGFQEDTRDFSKNPPGSVFDLTLPVWRVAECLLHARYMAERMGEPDTPIRFRFGWQGLGNRQLVSDRRMVNPRRAQQDQFVATIETDPGEIASNLPEVAGRIVKPLIELFDFLEMPAALPAEEVARLLGKR